MDAVVLMPIAMSMHQRAAAEFHDLLPTKPIIPEEVIARTWPEASGGFSFYSRKLHNAFFQELYPVGGQSRQCPSGKQPAPSIPPYREDGELSLADLACGPGDAIASFLDAPSLCALDGTCRFYRHANVASSGAWRALGSRAFYGLELDNLDGTFEKLSIPEKRDESIGFAMFGGPRASWSCKSRLQDWKRRYRYFCTEMMTFCAPFKGQQMIENVNNADEVAYLRCRLCIDLLDESSEHGVYIEAEVLKNVDNLSFSIVDFEDGGCSSVTFSPDTGSVIRERKVKESPREVRGEYIQILRSIPKRTRFHGSMGIYLHKGRLAFFRRCVGRANPASASSDSDSDSDDEEEESEESSDEGDDEGDSSSDEWSGGDGDSEKMGPWETTGFVTDMRWAQGGRATPCISFRDEGSYRVRIARVGGEPPVVPGPWSKTRFAGTRIGAESPVQGGDAQENLEDAWSAFDWRVEADGQ